MKYIFFKKYIISCDIKTLWIFYNCFLPRPNLYFRINKLVLFWEKIGWGLLLILYYLQILKFFSQNLEDTSFLIKRLGLGSEEKKSFIYLKKVSQKYIIIKKSKDKEMVTKNLEFYKKYSSKECKFISLPKNKKIDDNTLSVEFLLEQNFATKIRKGYFNWEELENLYIEFVKALRDLYGSEKTLIHGDLTPDNVYFFNKKFYIIDYNESHIYDIRFDEYLFLTRMLIDYYGSLKESILYKYFNEKDVLKFEKHAIKIKDERFI